MAGHHEHRASAAHRSRGRLGATLALTGSYLVVEVLGALWTGSLALAADAVHMLTDVGTLALALFAIWVASRPPTPAKTYGYYRAEILAALVNGVVLLGVAAWILLEAWARILAPRPVLGLPMLAIAVLGLLVNVAGAWLLHREAGASLNVRAAYLEVLTDALTSLGVVVAGAVILLTGWALVDPLVSVAIALFIVPRTWTLLRQAVNILLEGVPPHLDLSEIEAAMRQVDGVLHVHDLHVWTLTSGRDAMSAHAVVRELGEGDRLLAELHTLLHARFGIDHTTIQLEPGRSAALRLGPLPEV